MDLLIRTAELPNDRVYRRQPIKEYVDTHCNGQRLALFGL